MKDQPDATVASWQAIERLADQCVMCGLCLPHCPTYRVHHQESESPRGRISLAKALASGQLTDPQSALTPLEHCLGCLSCEGVCPAQVRYGELISLTRAQLPRRFKRVTRWVHRLAASPLAIRLGTVAYQAWSRLGRPTWFLPRTFAGLARGLPAASGAEPKVSGRAASQWLFSGCASSAIDQPARTAAARLLAELGVEVRAHPLTGCCGQLQRMAGGQTQARQLLDRLQARLDNAGVERLISVGSGCYGQLRRGLGAQRVIDLGQLLLSLSDAQPLRFQPLPTVVQLHCPCSQRSEVRDSQSWPRLLAQIPQLQILPLSAGPTCCGAAGSHCLEQPVTAAALRSELLDHLDANTQVLLTTNPGCALYLRAGLVERGLTVRVAHPVELLAEQWIDTAGIEKGDR